MTIVYDPARKRATHAESGLAIEFERETPVPLESDAIFRLYYDNRVLPIYVKIDYGLRTIMEETPDFDLMYLYEHDMEFSSRIEELNEINFFLVEIDDYLQENLNRSEFRKIFLEVWLRVVSEIYFWRKCAVEIGPPPEVPYKANNTLNTLRKISNALFVRKRRPAGTGLPSSWRLQADAPLHPIKDEEAGQITIVYDPDHKRATELESGLAIEFDRRGPYAMRERDEYYRLIYKNRIFPFGVSFNYGEGKITKKNPDIKGSEYSKAISKLNEINFSLSGEGDYIRQNLKKPVFRKIFLEVWLRLVSEMHPSRRCSVETGSQPDWRLEAQAPLRPLNGVGEGE
jgi:hypothetical protein